MVMIGFALITEFAVELIENAGSSELNEQTFECDESLDGMVDRGVEILNERVDKRSDGLSDDLSEKSLSANEHSFESEESASELSELFSEHLAANVPFSFLRSIDFESFG